MKKSILPAVLFCCAQSIIFSALSQTLYSATPRGGNDAGGTIIKFLPARNDLTVARSFESPVSNLGSGFIEASDGKLYGMKPQGGNSDVGAIFSFDPATSIYKKLFDFDGTNGRFPYGSLMQASDGKLYGMTLAGGISENSGYGVIFSFDPSTSTYTKLKYFDKSNGSRPYGSLVQANDGKLYGMTSEGGKDNKGVVFSFDLSSSTYAKLVDFHDTNSGNPYGSLIQVSDGKLYGMTYGQGYGVIFSFDPSSSVFTVVKRFNGSDGAYPYGSLVEASNGKLYGMTWGGGGQGVLFSLDPFTSTYKKLRDFHESIGGRLPEGDLIEATDGKLYGMTADGGSNGAGVIFSFDFLSSVYTELKDFDYVDLFARPQGSLVKAGNGKLYGMTRLRDDIKFWGKSFTGEIFSFDPASSALTKLKNFDNTNGATPLGGLVQASNGRLYGVTANGGANGRGVIFSFDPSTSVYTKLKDYNFIKPDGANPLGGLIQASDGKLYGVTASGGNNGSGIIFSFDPSRSAYKKLRDFGGDGDNPTGGLIEASDGKLYGMTNSGGSRNLGVIFSFDPTSSTYKKLKDFDATEGRPGGSLIQADDGKLYGMTQSGETRSDYGVIFSFDPSSGMYTKLRDFNDVDGRNPRGNLMQASDGKLYGMTYFGGKNGNGVIFSFDPISSVYVTLKDFDGTDGINPEGSLMQASDGKLYGMTGHGGNNGYGVIFSLDPFTSAYTKLKDYDDANGAYPGAGAAFIEVKNPPTVTLTTPANNATYLAGGNVYLNAAASDVDGTITKVEFYNNTTLLYTATDTPYAFKWQKVKKGNYTLTAKATDNSGLVTTSSPVNISVVPNKPPIVSIIAPANEQTFTTPANIHFEAVAADVDGRVTTVEFYNGSKLLTLERKVPYTYDWANVPAGIYTITARATDNWGAVTVSAPVTVTVISTASTVGSRPASLNSKMDKDGTFSLQLAPNPAKNIVNIYTTGLQNNKQATLSVISATGVIMKTMRLAGSAQTIPLNVSLLVSGVYTVKLVSGDKVVYGRFVKL